MMKMQYCKECGTPITGGMVFCSNCGTPLEASEKPEEVLDPSFTEEESKLVEQVKVDEGPIEVQEETQEELQGALQEKVQEELDGVEGDVRQYGEPYIRTVSEDEDPEPEEEEKETEVPDVVTGSYTASVKPKQVKSKAATEEVNAMPSYNTQKTSDHEKKVERNPLEEPMTVMGWIGTWLLLLIPLANIILPFVWAFGRKTNKSKKSFFQAYLIMVLIGIVLAIVFSTAIGMFIAAFSDGFAY